MTIETLLFDSRFNGPPRVVQGGILAGRVATLLGVRVEVTLRRPAPLATALRLVRHGSATEVHGTDTHSSDGRIATLFNGDEVLADVRALALAVDHLDAPGPPSLDEAERASHGYAGHQVHPFATCWVCGTERGPGDGMRIFAGPIGGSPMVAAVWTPDRALGGVDGDVSPEFVWAALDCPGGWAAVVDIPPRPVVLGRIAARLDRNVRSESPHVVIAWKSASDARKHQVGSAVFDEAGHLCAIARATWLEVDAASWA